MNHHHIGDPMKLCDGCVAEAHAEFRRQRFWRWVLVGFSFMIAAVCAIVLWRIGTGR